MWVSGLSWLYPSYVLVPDELALTFEDAYQHLTLLLEGGHIKPEAKDAIEAMDGLLTQPQ